MIHFYVGNDDGEPEMEDCRAVDISDEEPMVRRLGEENEDVATIVDSGADVALFPLSAANSGGSRCAQKSYPRWGGEKC